MPQKPIGELFSRIYIERGKPAGDSKRMRVRLNAFMERFHSDSFFDQIVPTIRGELGIEVRNSYLGYFFADAELRDLLDGITIIWRCMPSSSKTQWREFVGRVFGEENVGYQIDEEGGVHYLVDEEFERNRASVLRCLGEPKYAAVSAEFEGGLRRLDENPPDAKGAVRSVFEAVEILVKLMVDGEKVARLGPAEVERYLRPLVAQIYNENKVALDSANQVLSAFASWVNANQMYRHGQKVEEPAPPPLELAVVIVSAGASFLRWLVELDSRKAR